jgi:flagellar motor protein MotB
MANDHGKSAQGSHGGGGSHKKSHGGPGAHGGGGHEEHEGAPEWLISFADNVMLMMGVFVILLAMNMAKVTTGGIGGTDDMGGTPDERMADFAIALRSAFNNPVDIGSGDPRDAVLIRRLIQRAHRGSATQQGPMGENDSLQGVRDTDYNSIAATIEFAEHSGTLTDAARRSLAEVIEHTQGYLNIVEVRGHVSTFEIRDERSHGYDLAFQRALAVARELNVLGIDWSRIRMVSCGDSERISQGDYTRGVGAKDQRVEIVLAQKLRTDR